ncbi:MAG TPA: glycosyltransferase family 2 protein [Candidatus Lumbricidophila sp.]|nr:glycosyltransferase family 2 protein [Candidatus Lumbricidophila sp.]
MTFALASHVAVVTVTYQSSGHIGEFLRSLAASEPGGVRCVVVDNASRDAALTKAIAAEHGVAVVELAENLGYGGAMNAGVATLPADTWAVVIANPDVSVSPGAISSLVAALEQSPDVGSVGPAILNPDGSVYPSARAIPSLGTGVGHALLARLWPENPWSVAYRAERSAPAQRDAGWLSGAFVMVRRSAFEALNGFDERYFMYFEDVDLGYRLGRAGWRNMYVPAASVTHTGGHSTQSNSSRLLRVHHDSAYQFLRTRYAAWYFAPLRWALRVGLFLRSHIGVRRLER